MNKWEYKTMKIETSGFLGGKVNNDELEKQMNQLGDQGWEAVNGFDTNLSNGASRFVVVIFKRKVDYI